MRRRAEKCVAIVFFAVAIAVSLVGVAPAYGQTPSGLAEFGTDWCGSSLRSDWACRWHGDGSFDHSPLSWRPQQLGDSADVSAEKNSSVRIALRNQARCSVGSKAASEVVTRPAPDVLLQQVQGESVCASRKRVHIELCGQGGCHTELTTDGIALSREIPDEATISTTETVHRRIRVVACSGFVAVKAGGQFVSGRAVPGSRFVIEIDEYTYLTEDETRVETENESRAEAFAEAGSGVEVLEIGQLPGRGACQNRFVQEQERSVS
jgi:hypothetical protein